MHAEKIMIEVAHSGLRHKTEPGKKGLSPLLLLVPTFIFKGL